MRPAMMNRRGFADDSAVAPAAGGPGDRVTFGVALILPLAALGANAMAEVHLRRITADNEQECLDLRVNDAQAKLIAMNAQSVPGQGQSEAGAAGVYDRAACGYAQPRVPMVGFVMYEIDCGVGSILRLNDRSRASAEGLRAGASRRGSHQSRAE
jgi:hypothetical protein